MKNCILCIALLMLLSANVLAQQNKVQIITPESKKSTAFSYYNTSPESPDGQQIAYVQYDQPSESDENLSGSLWVYDRQQDAHKKIIDIQEFGNYHNGAYQQWVDDQRIAFMDGEDVKVVEVERGKVVFGPTTGLLGHEAHNQRILFVINQQDGGGEKGLYEVNVNTGERKLIARLEDFLPLAEQMPVDQMDSVQHWTMRHAQWSPDGKLISLRLDVKRGAKEPEKLLATMNSDGSNKLIFGAKPMHFQWYDNQTLMGHDHQVKDGQPDDRTLRRWDRTGKFIEILAGVGCHLGASPGRQWYASESWYGHSPVFLRLFSKGNTEPEAVIFENPHSNLIWDGHAHVNPSFSRDGKRVYFNYLVNDSIFQAAFYERASQDAGSQLIYQNDFEQAGLSDWQVESKDAEVKVKNGSMEIDAAKGCTVWLKKKLEAPLSISFDVTVVDKGGPNDRVSDLNAFWMAIDPDHPDHLFANERTGRFSEYDSLRLYYAGMGGNDNSTSRFRRYPGDGSRPILPEHDFSDEKYLLIPNQRMSIQIEVSEEGTRYFRDGELIFEMDDKSPYLSGWFGFRTVRNRMRIHHIEISKL